MPLVDVATKLRWVCHWRIVSAVGNSASDGAARSGLLAELEGENDPRPSVMDEALDALRRRGPIMIERGQRREEIIRLGMQERLDATGNATDEVD